MCNMWQQSSRGMVPTVNAVVFALFAFVLCDVANAVVVRGCDRQSTSSLSVNDQGVDMIESFEGWRANCYLDQLVSKAQYPNGLWTVGYGHACPSGVSDSACNGCKSKGTSFALTQSEGKELLRTDLNTKYAPCVKRLVTAKLTANEFSALVSFTYNLGCGTLQSSTLLRILNAGDYAGVPSEIKKFNKAGGKVLTGLVRRRDAEAALFSDGSCTSSSSSSTPSNDVTSLPQKQEAPSTSSSSSNTQSSTSSSSPSSSSQSSTTSTSSAGPGEVAVYGSTNSKVPKVVKEFRVLSRNYDERFDFYDSRPPNQSPFLELRPSYANLNYGDAKPYGDPYALQRWDPKPPPWNPHVV